MKTVVDILLIGAMILYFLRGWQHGIMYAITNLIGVIASYAVAVITAPLLAPVLTDSLGIAKVMGFILAWTCAFLLVIIIAFILKRTVLRDIAYHKLGEEDFHLPTWSKTAGGAISLLLGVIVLSIILLFYSILAGLSSQKLPDISDSTIVTYSSRINRNLAYKALLKTTKNEAIAKTFAKAISRPYKTMTHFRKIVQNVNFRRVVGSQKVIEAAVSGDQLSLVNDPSIIAMLSDKILMKRFVYLGLIKEDNYLKLNPDGTGFRYDLANSIIKFAQKVDQAEEGSLVKKNMTELKMDGLLDKHKLDKLLLDKRFHEILDHLLFEDK